jgi:hypothetical protein
MIDSPAAASRRAVVATVLPDFAIASARCDRLPDL